MKKRIIISVLTVTAIITLAIGCATPNPKAGEPIVDPTTGITNGVQPAFLPNKIVTEVTNTAQPYVGLVPAPYNTLVEGGLTVAALIAGFIAKQKNLAATAMAAGIVKAAQTNPTLLATIHEVAANTSTAAAAVVASHIADATN